MVQAVRAGKSRFSIGQFCATIADVLAHD
jgi:hypothetical protein